MIANVVLAATQPSSIGGLVAALIAVAVILLIVMVQVFQSCGTSLSVHSDKRLRNRKTKK